MTLKDLEKILFKGLQRKANIVEGDLLKFFIETELADNEKRAKEYLEEWKKARKINSDPWDLYISWRINSRGKNTYRVQKRFSYFRKP
ncbi:MAG: hypothetical protein KJ949_00455 [Nanoarchaeota archaeon]|nr:hypothetical protein [Nanoarchaeota archaeon]MBU4308518.1 hypothetical protein [Nanoarchaeota archaeon]